MTDHITKIREALAEVPTPREWTVELVGPETYVATEVELLAKVSGDEISATALFMAACNPVAIRSLLAALDEAQKDAKRYRWLLSEAQNKADWGDGPCLVTPLGGPDWHQDTSRAIDAAITAQEGGRDG